MIELDYQSIETALIAIFNSIHEEEKIKNTFLIMYVDALRTILAILNCLKNIKINKRMEKYINKTIDLINKIDTFGISIFDKKKKEAVLLSEQLLAILLG